MSAIVGFAAVVIAFAMLFTVHLLACIHIGSHAPKWHGAVALIVPPLAPWFEIRRRSFAWAIVWILAAVIYITSVAIVLR